MLAPPKGEYMWRALAGNSPAGMYAGALLGPLQTVHRRGGVLQGFYAEGARPVSITTYTIVIFMVLLALPLAIAILIVLPYSEVTQSAGRKYWILEVLFPGVSRAWRWGGGLVLVLWAYFVVQGGLLLWKGTPYLLTMSSTGSIEKSFGIPVDESAKAALLFVPGWFWIYAAPALLFAANLFLVLRTRRMNTVPNYLQPPSDRP